jgi:hypothetical protein
MGKVIVFDIDGTLANIEHRRQYVATKPKNWKAFTAGIPNDTPYEEIVYLARTFDNGFDNVILCSGRGEESRVATEDQMRKFGVPFDEIYMRAAGDYRKDSIVKVELLHQIRAKYGNPYLWFDDRQQVVDAIRAEGVRVLQVAPGDF